MRPSEVCVLIPVYNESKNIARVARSVTELGFDLLIVDDGSTDSSAEIIQKLGVHYLLQLPNQGKGSALRRGLEWVQKERYEAVILMDGDGQHAPEDLPQFLEALERRAGDLIVGNRMAQPHGMPLVRRLTNRFMSALLSRAAGQTIPDTQCGFRALRRNVIEGLSLYTDRFETESEILLQAAEKGFAISSIPVHSVYRDEVSHIRPVRDTIRFFSFLWGRKKLVRSKKG